MKCRSPNRSRFRSYIMTNAHALQLQYTVEQQIECENHEHSHVYIVITPKSEFRITDRSSITHPHALSHNYLTTQLTVLKQEAKDVW